MNRASVKLRLLEVGEYALTDLELYEDRTETIPARFTWDGGAITASAFFVGLSTGASEPTSIGTNHQSADDFGIECQIIIPNCPDGQTAELAAQRAYNALDAVLRRLQRLVDPAGEVPTAEPPISSSQPAPWDVAKAYIAEATGPYHAFPPKTPGPRSTPGPNAMTGIVDFTVRCVTEIR